MKIGELARRSGLAPSRIRFYEASGLLRGIKRKENGYREFGSQALSTLEIITSAQGAGFTLDEIRNLLPGDEAGWQHAELLQSLERKVADIEGMQKRLAQNKAQLLVAIKSVKNRPDTLACADRAQWVLDKLKESAAPSSTSSVSLRTLR